MADYAIGDIQGCYSPLMRLLDHVQFDDHADRLWFVGDLVNRGSESLAVLRFIKQLPIAPQITLGNHDLHFLHRLFVTTTVKEPPKEDTLTELLTAPDALVLGEWLRQQSILVHDPDLNVVMCHAGIAPCWNLNQAKAHATELESVLHGPDFQTYLMHMYGNQPDHWSDSLRGFDRLRVITNFFTRMRFWDRQGHLDLTYDRDIDAAPPFLVPWFLVPERQLIPTDLLFGHWAALEGKCSVPGLYALDTGCLWGGPLTALRIQDRKRFSVPGL